MQTNLLAAVLNLFRYTVEKPQRVSKLSCIETCKTLFRRFLILGVTPTGVMAGANRLVATEMS